MKISASWAFELEISWARFLSQSPDGDLIWNCLNFSTEFAAQTYFTLDHISSLFPPSWHEKTPTKRLISLSNHCIPSLWFFFVETMGDTAAWLTFWTDQSSLRLLAPAVGPLFFRRLPGPSLWRRLWTHQRGSTVVWGPTVRIELAGFFWEATTPSGIRTCQFTTKYGQIFPWSSFGHFVLWVSIGLDGAGAMTSISVALWRLPYYVPSSCHGHIKLVPVCNTAI